ncbi:MAG: DNA replication/repair protein RecF [Dehalococcoidia bacterium]|nr:DNA replication/repair protein RecF [Dehalococcoidia bacterium]
MAYIARLSLTNYRNFRQADVDLPKGVSVFYGSNAQGKTALLEAAYTLAVGRSFRTERERQVLNFDAARMGDAAYITGVACRDGQQMTAVVGYLPSARVTAGPDREAGASSNTTALPPVSKEIRVNRQRSTASGLVGRIGATLFSVDDLELVLGAPSNRRRFLDILICQAHRPYLDALQRYQAALRHRNGLLRRRREADIAPEEFDYWDEQLLQSGTAVTVGRDDAIRRLSDSACCHHRNMAEADQTLTLEYRPSVAPQETADNTAAVFREQLQRHAAREQATAATAVGPHRDNFAIFMNGLDANSFASRGEARTIALSLRLAEADYLAQAREDDPVILLDDVFSEMDDRRRVRVLQKVSQYRQTLMTTTDAEPLRAILGDTASYFCVADGVVSPEAGPN